MTGGPVGLTWSTTGSDIPGDGATWDIQNNRNWSRVTQPFSTVIVDQFFQEDTLTFNDSNNGHYTVPAGVIVQNGSIAVSNSASDYTISGTGAIGGTTGLSKSGTAKLLLGMSNTYTGPTTINAPARASALASTSFLRPRW